MLKSREFELPIYSSKIIFIYSDNFEQIVNMLTKSNIDESVLKNLRTKYQGVAFMVNDENLGNYHYMVVIKNKDKYEEIDTVAHEIFHLTYNILHSKDIKFNTKNEETYAYLTGYLNKEFFKFKNGK